ncbi:hypothetical protein PAMP_012302 [Pampus punctatissimus]
MGKQDKNIEVRYQAGQVREALLEVRETTADPVVRVEPNIWLRRLDPSVFAFVQLYGMTFSARSSTSVN